MYTGLRIQAELPSALNLMSSYSARLAQASPSVSVEKGAYRMRAPPNRSPSKLRRSSRSRNPPPSMYEKQMAMLVVFLLSATLACFGAAYYLFTTRWATRTLSSALRNSFSDDAPRLEVVQFDFDDNQSPTSPLVNSEEKYLAYLPHSGFHNQRIAFENALVLSRLLNRTLLVPPVRLGNKPLSYVPFDELRELNANSSKVGLEHCRTTLSDPEPPLECVDYFDYTYVPWEWLVNLTEIKSEQKLVQRWNLTDAWLEDHLRITSDDTFSLKDAGRNHFSFQDFTSISHSLSRKYLEPLHISFLAGRRERFIQLGTLFGSSRLHLRNPKNILVRKQIRQSMAFANPHLMKLADNIRDALGGDYLGAHIRLGDGLFLESGPANVRLVWWKLLHTSLGFSLKDILALEKGQAVELGADDAALAPPHIPLDIPSLRVPHPRLPPLSLKSSPSLRCRGGAHTSIELLPLNVPLFISTDAPDPQTDPLLSRFTQTFPCTFFLEDFSAHTAALDSLQSGYDGLHLKSFLIPFLDAMIAARAWQVVGTEQSTFSAFVQDVLWRTYHGWDIVQRG
ncbi:hypothetical protein AcV7_005030 [Taiwanofungus camphoratus]|nr:hypothetical protein AcV7_005030 [Antrodia cinnamomea]